ncbi:MAG: UvrD-helicase domain-containing protein, partial [Myxococcales bacterium]|nr:UvrD-helicase domain-containing protein [Myxococcales bacterium]
GDPKQAIYGFRGADVHTYLVARDELQRLGAARVPLTTNFRSSPPCIRAVNHLLDQDAPSPLFSGPIRYDAPVQAGQDRWGLSNAAGEPVAPVCLWQYRPPPPRGSKQRDRVPKYLLQEAFARALARSLRDLFDDEAGLWVDDPKRSDQPGQGRRRLTPKDVFVLVRGRWDAVDAARALREAGVPHAFYKQEGLFQSTEAHDLRDVLAAVADPQRRSARLKAFATPIFGVPWRELDRYRGLAAGHPLVERLHAWRQLGEQERYPELFHQILHGSGLMERELFLRADDRPLVNYQHILEMLLQAATARRLALPEVVDLLQRYIDRAEQPEGSDGNVQRLTGVDDAVQIMTVHKSKGLEAPVVCLFGGFAAAPVGPVNVVHDQLAGRRVLVGDAARDTAAEQLAREHREEDERLLYVALTRARSRLYLPFLESTRGVPGTFFEPLKDRLMHLHKTEELPPELFHREPVDAARAPQAAQHPAAEPVGAWQPPAVLLRDPREIEARFAHLRARHAPLLVTSYTRMKQAKEAAAALDLPIEADEFTHDPGGLAEVDEASLPGGRHVGRCLHEAIEALDFAELAAAFDDWRRLPAVSDAFDAVMR